MASLADEFGLRAVRTSKRINLAPDNKVIVHPIARQWTWTQVSKNGRAAAHAPITYDNQTNAHRAAKRQAGRLRNSVVVVDPDYERD